MEDINHEYYMGVAYQEALQAFDEEEVPIGAVITCNKRIIGRGHNQIEALQDATAHAEIIAIGAASNALSTWRLNDCTLYVTLEPCLMCLGSILLSRIGTVVYGAKDNRFGALETSTYKDKAEQAYKRFPETIGGIMQNECKYIIQSFFQKIRKKN